jgi:hypothetical protein
MILLSWINFARPQNVHIADYDVPISRADRVDFSGKLGLQGRDERTAMMYWTRCRWQSYYNSLPYAWQWEFDGRLNIQNDNRRDRSGRSQKASYREYVAIHGQIRKYVKDDGLLFFGMAADADWNYLSEHVASWVGGSVGLGRFVEATALAKALRIEEFLIKEKILDNHLSKETMLNLAAIIEREDEYRKLHGDTYTVWWYAEMDTTIMAAGLIPGTTVGPVGLLRMREVIERETVRPRMHGWKIETGAGIKFSDAHESKTVGTQPFIAAAYACPIDLKSQVYLTGRASAEPDDRIGKMFHLYAELTFSHELTNRIDFMLSEVYRHDKEEAQSSVYPLLTTRENTLTADFLFYLENKITFTAYARLNHRNHYRSDPGSSSREIQRDWQLGASVSYRVF